MPRPRARCADQHRADVGRGVQKSEHRGSTQARGDLREHGVRSAEEHGADVDEIGPEQLRPAFGITQPVGNSPQAGPVGVRGWRTPPHQRERRRRRHAGRDADSVGERQAAREQSAGQQRRACARDGAEQAGQRGGRGQVLMRNEQRDERLDGRPLDAQGTSEDRGEHEEQPELLPEQRVHQQDGAAYDGDRLGDEDEPTSLERVRERAADQPGQQDGEQLGDAEQADDQRRVADPVRLERQRDVADHHADRAGFLAGDEQAEVAGVLDRGEVRLESREDAGHRPTC